MSMDPTFGEALEEAAGDVDFAALIAPATEVSFASALDDAADDVDFAALIAPDAQ